MSVPVTMCYIYSSALSVLFYTIKNAFCGILDDFFSETVFHPISVHFINQINSPIYRASG